jgi:hypothetical protein
LGDRSIGEALQDANCGFDQLVQEAQRTTEVELHQLGETEAVDLFGVGPIHPSHLRAPSEKNTIQVRRNRPVGIQLPDQLKNLRQMLLAKVDV